MKKTSMDWLAPPGENLSLPSSSACNTTVRGLPRQNCMWKKHPKNPEDKSGAIAGKPCPSFSHIMVLRIKTPNPSSQHPRHSAHLLHCQELQDASFHLFQTIVVLEELAWFNIRQYANNIWNQLIKLVFYRWTCHMHGTADNLSYHSIIYCRKYTRARNDTLHSWVSICRLEAPSR